MADGCMEIRKRHEIPFPEVPEGLDRPFVFVNCASSADGKLALPDGRQTRISSDDDIAYVYYLRNWADAVVVGINTVLKDDPKLTVKEKYIDNPSQPLRVIVDSTCRTPEGSKVLNEHAGTLIATTEGHGLKYAPPQNVELLECGDGEYVDLRKLLTTLWGRGVRRVMVEGGGTLISTFLQGGMVDEFLIFIGDMIIGGGEAPSPVMGAGAGNFADIVHMERYAVIPMEGGVRIHYTIAK